MKKKVFRERYYGVQEDANVKTINIPKVKAKKDYRKKKEEK